MCRAIKRIYLIVADLAVLGAAAQVTALIVIGSSLPVWRILVNGESDARDWRIFASRATARAARSFAVLPEP